VAKTLYNTGNLQQAFGQIFEDWNLEEHFNTKGASSGGATGRTGEDTSPPVLFKVNFLICPNPVRKMGGGGVRL
jgi:hypothetical protein